MSREQAQEHRGVPYTLGQDFYSATWYAHFYTQKANFMVRLPTISNGAAKLLCNDLIDFILDTASREKENGSNA